MSDIIKNEIEVCMSGCNTSLKMPFFCSFALYLLLSFLFSCTYIHLANLVFFQVCNTNELGKIQSCQIPSYFQKKLHSELMIQDSLATLAFSAKCKLIILFFGKQITYFEIRQKTVFLTIK